MKSSALTRSVVFDLAVLLALGLGVLLGASAQASAQAPRRGGIVTIAVAGDVPSLDCQANAGFYFMALVSPFYSRLLKYDLDKYPELVGDLAESWSISQDGLNYTFKLRPDVKFHDGAPLTSADVKATFDRIINPPPGVPSLRRDAYAEVTAIETPDPLTVTFRLSEPNVAFLTTLANPFSCIYSARRLAADPMYPATTPYGTGAFQFDKYNRGESMSGRRFDGYFLPGRPYLDGFKVQFLSPNTFINNLIAGRVDMIGGQGISPQDAAQVASALGSKIQISETISNFGHMFLSPNHMRKPFDDVRVRRALSLALDRRNGLVGLSKISTFVNYGGALRPDSSFALTNAELMRLPIYASDSASGRAEARKLLAEVGPIGKIKILNQTAPAFAAFGVFVVSQLQQIGLQIEQEVVPQQTYLTRRATGDFDLLVETNNPPSDDPILLLPKFLPGSPSNFSYGKISDPILSDLFTQQKAAIDPAIRKKLVNALETRLLTEAYLVPGFWSGHRVVMPKNVHGWRLTPNTSLNYDLIDVWRSE